MFAHNRKLMLVVAIAFLVSACARSPDETVLEADPRAIANLHILSFNAWGELQNPAELELARERLRLNTDIDRIIILSYGWANDGQASYAAYRRMVLELSRHIPPNQRRPNVAVIAVGWDSSQSGLRKLLTDIVPLPGVGAAIAWLPDRVLFPFSFWSKAAQADRIGFSGLRASLNELLSIYGEERPHPEIFLLGHSFGTRVVSGLMVDSIGGIRVGSIPFNSAEYIRGAALLQPALTLEHLNLNAEFPVMATMSQHDHAVGFLYPLANVSLNSLGFTMFEAFVQRYFLGNVQRGLEFTAGTAQRVITAPLTTNVPTAPPKAQPAQDYESFFDRHSRRVRRTTGEILAIPLTMLFTIAVTPIDYAYIQVRGLVTHPINHVMDSLAQFPIIEIPVEGLSNLLGREIPWGQRSKGIFTLGPIHEGVGRMSTPRLFRPSPPVYSLQELAELPGPPSGVFVVDATPIIRRGEFDIDFSKPLPKYTISWFDKSGAHSDFRNAEVGRLLSWLANGTPLVQPEMEQMESRD